MKKLLPFLACLIMPVSAMASATVTVDTAGKVLYPTNFFAANSVSQTGSVAALTVRVTAIENTTGSIATASQYLSVSGRVTVVENGTGTLATVSGLTSATGRISVLEGQTGSYFKVSNTSNLVVHGSITGQVFYGNGSGLTGVTATATGAVTYITVGGTTNTGAISFIGSNILNGTAGTLTFQNVEYKSWQIVPNTTSWAMTMDGPRDVAFTVTNIFSKVDAYQATFSVVMCSSNSPWLTVTTNLAGVVALPAGTVTPCSFVIPAGYEWGVNVTDYDPRTLNLRVRAKTVY